MVLSRTRRVERGEPPGGPFCGVTGGERFVGARTENAEQREQPVPRGMNGSGKTPERAPFQSEVWSVPRAVFGAGPRTSVQGGPGREDGRRRAGRVAQVPWGFSARGQEMSGGGSSQSRVG